MSRYLHPESNGDSIGCLRGVWVGLAVQDVALRFDK
jgi:hypothetical protein